MLLKRIEYTLTSVGPLLSTQEALLPQDQEFEPAAPLLDLDSHEARVLQSEPSEETPALDRSGAI